MKIEMIAIELLQPYELNAKNHPQKQIDLLAKSIKKNGWTQPIVIDKKNGVVIGHGRLEAAKKLKLLEVPTLRVEHLSETEVRELRILDNKVAETSWDHQLLKLEFESLSLENDFEIELTGFDEKQLENMFENDESINKYTGKIAAPIYEITNEKPAIHELFDTTKTDALLKKIEVSNLSEKEKKFLYFAAHRHTVFNYEKIAEYYAHSEKQMQEEIENSALVIVDFKKAIENGFVTLTKNLHIENEEQNEQ